MDVQLRQPNESDKWLKYAVKSIKQLKVLVESNRETAEIAKCISQMVEIVNKNY